MPTRRMPAMRFDMDHSAPTPAMTSTAVGIDRVAYRSPAPVHRIITVFDTVDERLLRAGVVVAHRMADGVGEWYLAAPSWEPRLPAERVEPLDAKAGLPESFVRMIRPLTRRGSLGPVATLESKKQEYLLRSEQGELLGTIVDERVSMRRGEAPIRRYREVTVTPGTDMTTQQGEHVISSMQAVGATQVGEFPTVQQRLGPPATGLTDFPKPRTLQRDATMEELVSAVFAADLTALTELLLEAERDKRPHVASLNAQLEAVQRDLRGLAHALKPGWREQVESLLAGLPFEHLADATDVALEVSEELVHEVRAPKLGDVASVEAAPLLLERAQQAALIMADRCGALTTGASEQEWEAALQSAEILAISSAVAGPVLGKSLRRIVRRLQTVTEHLRACTADWSATETDLEELSVEEAFELGARIERGRASSLTERARFVALWPDRLDELRQLLSRAKKTT